ncbi:MAG: rRNA ((527)-N(7))-methyltransferase RsmG [Acidobacteriota bacterium]
MTFRDLVAQEFAPYGPLTPLQLDQLQNHYDLLVRWNPKLNLTRITSLEDAARLHYCESLYLGRCLPEGALSIADIGSGPGFPGVPIAILRPECQVTLVESHQRKAVFLRESTRGLANVTVFSGRAEDLATRFDWVVARAVTPEDVLRLPISDHFALLVGPEDSERLGGRPLPWGKGRFVASVPRGTLLTPGV